MEKMHCQNCRSPLRLDSSLEQLNPAAFKLILDSANTADASRPPPSRKSLPAYQQDRLAEYDSAARNAPPTTFKRSLQSSRTTQPSTNNPNMSFIMLNDSQLLEPPSPTRPKPPERKPSVSHTKQDESHILSNRMEAADRIFEILSSRSDIDHPVCAECTDLLVEGLEKRLAATNKEREAYVEFLRRANAEVPSEEEIRDAQRKLGEARERETTALRELESLEAEKAAMEQEILQLDIELHELGMKEDVFWAERNAHADQVASFQDERDRVDTQFEHDTKQLQRLQRANVYNDTFAIGHDGSFGTINGLRLGRLPDRPVEWAEINAAWGQTCLLLATVAHKLDFRFHGFELRPQGSTSKILETLARGPGQSSSHRSAGDGTGSDRIRVHELYSSGEYAISIGLFNRRFDAAMVAFLECLRQLIVHVRKTEIMGKDGNLVAVPKFPYIIEKDRIGDSSIKLGGFNQEEVWTKACKGTLICCKYLLAHASNVSEQAA
jgi:beclin 1